MVTFAGTPRSPMFLSRLWSVCKDDQLSLWALVPETESVTDFGVGHFSLDLEVFLSPAGRRQWSDATPNTLLSALAQAELIWSTMQETAEKEEDDSDVEIDEHRQEPGSDNDDT